MSVALQSDNGVTFLGASTARVSRMLERLDSVPEFAKTVADEGSGSGRQRIDADHVRLDDRCAGRDWPVEARRPTFAVQYKDIPGVSPDDLIPVIVRLCADRVQRPVRGRRQGPRRRSRPARRRVGPDPRVEAGRRPVRRRDRSAAARPKSSPSADLAPGEYAVVLRLHERKKLPGATVLSQSGEGRLFGTAWAFSV